VSRVARSGQHSGKGAYEFENVAPAAAIDDETTGMVSISSVRASSMRMTKTFGGGSTAWAGTP